MVSAEPGGSAAAPPRPKLEAAPGQRRLRRTMHYVAADGRPAVKCAELGLVMGLIVVYLLCSHDVPGRAVMPDIIRCKRESCWK